MPVEIVLAYPSMHLTQQISFAILTCARSLKCGREFRVLTVLGEVRQSNAHLDTDEIGKTGPVSHIPFHGKVRSVGLSCESDVRRRGLDLRVHPVNHRMMIDFRHEFLQRTWRW